MHRRSHTASGELAIIQEIKNGHIGVMAAIQKCSITKTTQLPEHLEQYLKIEGTQTE